MPVDITIPSPGESINEVVLGPWQKSEGDWVEKDEPLVEIESDKATLDLPAPESGVLHINASEGDELAVGASIGSIDPDAEKPSGGSANGQAAQEEKKKEPKQAQAESKQAAATAEPKPQQQQQQQQQQKPQQRDGEQEQRETAVADENAEARATSVAKKIAEERGIDLASVHGTGPSGRITKSDVLNAGQSEAKQRDIQPQQRDTIDAEPQRPMVTGDSERGIRRERMTTLRRRIAARLVEAQHNAAMLTTFNEADMSAVMALRKKHKDEFTEKHGVNLGFMSFFVKAAVSALQAYPRVNAYIDGNEIEYHDYCDVSVAVGTEKGLVVPVIRDAHDMSFADIESTIRDFATRARDGKLTIDEMTGGTFTISNGGVYGSLNSTPILNPPQSAILGMHKIMNRAVEHPDKPGELALRPMMYLALSYDHRIVDGAEAVGFLVHIKNAIEKPERLLLGM